MFSVKRSFHILQLRYDFHQSELVKSVLMAFGLIAVSTGIMFSIGGVDGHKIRVLYVAAALFAASRIFFSWAKVDAELSRFLGIPATEAEKWFAEWINSLVIVPVLVAVPIIFAAIFNSLIQTGNPVDWSVLWGGLGGAFRSYLIMHPILFFAAIYFHKAVVLKLFSCLVLLAIVTVLTVLAILGESLMHSGGHGLASHGWVPCLPGNSCLWVYSLFFWGMSYLRQRELEVA